MFDSDGNGFINAAELRQVRLIFFLKLLFPDTDGVERMLRPCEKYCKSYSGHVEPGGETDGGRG